MRKVLRIAWTTTAVIVGTAAVAFVVFVYTMPVRILPNTPRSENSRLSEDLLQSKKCVFIGAHPDDIEFYAAGLVYLLEKRGADVSFALATRGGKGRAGRAKQRLESLRTQHQHDAASILGGAKVVFYDYPDKDLPSYVSPLAHDLIELIRKLKPDVVLSWDPDYIYNPHPDHVAAAQAAEIAIDATDSRACFYGTREPNLWIGYGDSVFRVKIKALRAHRTETPWPYYILGRRYLVKKSAGEGEKIEADYAEVFRCE